MRSQRCSGRQVIIRIGLIFFLCTLTATAGDPAVKYFKHAQFSYQQGETETWTVEVANPFAFVAKDYQASFHVVNKNDPSDTEIFIVPTFDFLPSTTMDVNIAPQLWTAHTPGEYYVEYRSFSPDDIDTTNNSLRHDFSVEAKQLLDRNGVSTLLQYHMTQSWKLNMDLTLGYVSQQPYDGNRVTSKDSTEFSMTVDSTQWFAWVDLDKYSEYGKDQYFVIIDREDSTVQRFTSTWYPLVDGKSYPGMSGQRAEDDIVVGDPPSAEHGDGTHLTDTLSQAPPKKKTCALIIAGGDESPSAYRDRFINGADFMKGNLTRERLGAQVHPDDVIVLTDPSPAEVQEAMRQFRDSCETFYFVYTGHGGTYSMDTRDSSYLWYSLFIDLDSLNAENYQVMISSCHAGAAIDNFDDLISRYRDANMTIVASSAADTSSYTQAIVTGSGDTITVSRYLWAFAQCYGDPAADRDGDGLTSFEEAHRWTVAQNPQISWAGKGIVEVQRPQIRVHARATPSREALRLRDADAMIYPDLIPDSTATLTVEVQPLDTAMPKEDSIYTISAERTWEFRYELKTGYRMDLQLTYDGAIDDVADTAGSKRLGIVRRDSSGAQWKRHYPTLWDPKSATLTAIDVENFSDWAIAVIENSAPHAAGAMIVTARDTESPPVRPWVADRDTGDIHQFLIEAQPSNGTARIENNALRYLPASNFVGDDSFSFRATDAGGASIVGIATVQVTGSNRIPAPMPDSATLPEDNSIMIDVLANDVDADGDELRIVSITAPRHGNAVILGDTLLQYQPWENYHGTDTVRYTVSDPAGGNADANLVLRITPVNDPPAVFDRQLPLPGSSVATPDVAFRWTTSIDVDGDPITYVLAVSVEGNNDVVSTEDTTLQYDFSRFSLSSGSHTVQWMVRATDGLDTTEVNGGMGSFTLDVTTKADPLSRPASMALHAPWPNPSRGAIHVAFSLQSSGHVELELLAMDGRRMMTLASERLEPGNYQRSADPVSLSPGMYLVRLRLQGQQLLRVIALLR